MIECKTKEDAYIRIFNTRLGYLQDPTEEYLIALRKQIYGLLNEVNREIAQLPVANG